MEDPFTGFRGIARSQAFLWLPELDMSDSHVKDNIEQVNEATQNQPPPLPTPPPFPFSHNSDSYGRLNEGQI